MTALKKQLHNAPAVYAKDILLVDEGDTMLVKEIKQQLGMAYPRHLVLLSAVPRSAWTGAQKLCFKTVKDREGKYLDVQDVFPAQRAKQAEGPRLLPESPGEILKLAVNMAKEQPVFFYG